MDDEHLGLRELKKRQTRDSISAAALKLTEEKGLSEVTIEEIAREAFVSPRTISNYFASKEEAVLAAGPVATEQLLEDFSTSNSDDPPLEVLGRLMSNHVRDHPDCLQKAARMIELEEANPSLRPFRLAQEVELVTDLGRRVAQRTGTDFAADVYPSLVASAASAALLTSLSIWAQAGFPEGRLQQLIEESFSLASAGYRRRAASPIRVEIESIATPQSPDAQPV
jgi:AcrR family transcriptional regulator